MTELAIRNVDDLMQLSKVTAMSDLLPDTLRRKPADVAIILLYGAELGLGPGQALQGIYVVDGRPSLAAQTWLALARRAGHRVSVVEHTASTCTVKIVRGDTGEEHVSTFTLDDAVQTGKVQIKDGKPFARSRNGKALPWETSTKAMLLARAVSAGCRFICPEIALGFYAEGELDDPAPVQVESEVVRPADAPVETEPQQPEAVAEELAEIVEEFGPVQAEIGDEQ